VRVIPHLSAPPLGQGGLRGILEPAIRALLRKKLNQAAGPDHDLIKILDFPAIAHYNEYILNIWSN